MMQELEELQRALQPAPRSLLVADAMTGQEAVVVAEEFKRRVGITGLILTKMDGDARGGAALSIRAVTGVPIKFIGTGEKIDALEPFHPDRVASRILGMGDVLSLIERAQAGLRRAEGRGDAAQAAGGPVRPGRLPGAVAAHPQHGAAATDAGA